MKVLNLIIKQKYFDAILQGRKVQEFRELRPATYKRLVETDSEGFNIIDENENSIPIKYDAIRFFVGYNKNRDSALVEVLGAFCEVFVDEKGEPIQYEYGKGMWVAEQVVYNLGRILEKDIHEKSRV